MRNLQELQPDPGPATDFGRLAEQVANDMRIRFLAESFLRILEDHRWAGDHWLRMQTASLIEADSRWVA